ncbi:MAG: YebC/PmpR family DNA-binding transcriptional regulator [Alphaproteobacteria bacterium]|nr:YebC/PmpR family DNA-binding transcriptional regulator [Alphaproteobacteria bacterium]MBE8220017.1 YebC/PmpR family DNA-binding transcriptional regulator [Alphaproteobacteria bacterium]
MAGHSKFKNIQHRKGAQDKKRARVFSRLTKEIMVAAKMGLPDPDANPRLRTAILAARGQNMPKDNIDRAIKKSTDDGETTYEEMRYEGFAPGGVGVIIETLTDNRNRTASAVRSAFSKAGGNLGETGAVSFMFDRLGAIGFKKEVGGGEAVFEAALEAGASDVESDDEGHNIFCAMEDLNNVSAALEEALGAPREVGIIWRANNNIAVEGDAAASVLKFIDALDELDDVQNVYANFDIADDVMETLSASA